LVLHLVCLGGLIFLPRHGLWWWSLLAANHLLLTAAGMWPRSRLLGQNLSRLPPGEKGAEAGVVLTFDDGPDPEVTPKVLQQLDHFDAKASFFLIGERAERHPELVAEILRRGHRVENHTYRHSWAFAFSPPLAMGREIDRAQAILTTLAGRPPTYFRAPAGMRNPFLSFLLSRRGLALASWTRRGFDAVEKDPDRVLERLLRDLQAGDILLLHDGSSARDRQGRVVSLVVLPKLLAALRSHGLSAMPLPPAK
jgi:peptidoglycan/xylan/chitin deacetylase (PgdA/CDA1 family)